jgi:hypothetical protein
MEIGQPWLSMPQTELLMIQQLAACEDLPEAVVHYFNATSPHTNDVGCATSLFCALECLQADGIDLGTKRQVGDLSGSLNMYRHSSVKVKDMPEDRMLSLLQCRDRIAEALQALTRKH